LQTYFTVSFVYAVQIFWNESGQLVCIATEESFFILRYNAEAIETAKDQPESVTEDGVEAAFDVSYVFANNKCLLDTTDA
jgi:Coatomer WD associated region